MNYAWDMSRNPLIALVLLVFTIWLTWTLAGRAETTQVHNYYDAQGHVVAQSRTREGTTSYYDDQGHETAYSHKNGKQIDFYDSDGHLILSGSAGKADLYPIPEK